MCDSGGIPQSLLSKNAMKTNLVTAVMVASFFIVVAAYSWHQPWPPMRVAGGVLGLVSLILLLMARYQLGRSFSIQAKARVLVTDGLYARIRNPIYVFGASFIVAASLFLPSWLLVVALVVLAPMQIIRARREAAVLEAAFGERYREYRRQTWF